MEGKGHFCTWYSADQSPGGCVEDQHQAPTSVLAVVVQEERISHSFVSVHNPKSAKVSYRSEVLAVKVGVTLIAV